MKTTIINNLQEELQQEAQFLPEWIHDFLIRWGMNEELASWLDQCLSLALLLLFVFMIGVIIDLVNRHVITRIVRRTKNKWDDLFVDGKIIHNLSYVIPSIIFSGLLPFAINSDVTVTLLGKIVQIIIIVFIIKLVFSITRVFAQIYSRKSSYATKPIQVIFQIINVFAIFLAGLVILSIVLDKSFGTLIAGLGASMAILMLIFKDSILGFVSGWQLSSNDMLRIGDWITAPKYGADGTVIEISLYSVKVQNFDNTITTIPPYALISDSFQNWRGMTDSGGRRIKRSLNVDINSIRFCDSEMLERLSRMPLLKGYIAETEEKLRGQEETRQTNVGIFRAYITAFLKQHPAISKDMTCMVRQLQPTEKGLPLEIYCFVNKTDWTFYENTQSDIFDHILSIAKVFDIRIFQFPTGIEVLK